MSTEIKEQVTETQRIYEGKVVNLRVDTIRLPNGKLAKREIVEHHGAVAIVPLLDAETVVMVRQYRHPAEGMLLEIPAGGLEENEDLEECARRELSEEVNLQAVHMVKLFQSYVAPGYSTELIHTFLAYRLSRLDGTPDEDEFIDIAHVKLADVPDMIARGEIQDGKSIGGLLAAMRLLPTLKLDKDVSPEG
jgi:ADP-ribose pyrophosphatase